MIRVNRNSKKEIGLPKKETPSSFLGRGEAAEKGEGLADKPSKEASFDEVKLIRAYDECLGIRSRRRT